MLPIYERLDARKPLLRIKLSHVAVFGISLALGAFVYCIVWSIVMDFERATYTHCEVSNYLPSISAAIGSYEPQRTVWRLAIILHLPVRLVLANLYSQYYKNHIRRNRRIIAKFAVILNVIENLALVCLSLWTSADDYEVHKTSFITFIACSEIYMLIVYFLNRKARKLSLTETEEKSLRYKGLFFTINVLAFSLAAYCFIRHNTKCESGVYTIFALFEYIVVLTNMAYHMTAYWDFYGLYMFYDWQKGLYMSHA
ncbi:post-GPI attachment to proteins factor 2-like [Glossina fuscipes fuscipes]